MAINQIDIKIKGFSPLLMNNPRTVDVFDEYSKHKKQITAKRVKTDEELLELRNIEIESKLYFDDELKIYVPTRWVMASICGWSFKKSKISKADIRSAVFLNSDKAKLTYRDMNKVKKQSDIVGNPFFRHLMNLKQGQVRVVKAAPIFHDWSFEVGIEFDDSVIDELTLIDIIQHAAKYGGYGDFRPTFGRAIAEVK